MSTDRHGTAERAKFVFSCLRLARCWCCMLNRTGVLGDGMSSHRLHGLTRSMSLEVFHQLVSFDFRFFLIL